MSRRIVLGVSGGIAAYKAAELARVLIKNGHQVRVILTAHGRAFVAPLTFAALTGSAVYEDELSAPSPDVPHVELARWGELLVIAPATANILGKLAHGIADDFLSTYYLAHRGGPVLLAPAMNTFMWAHPAVAENLRILRQRGALVVDPAAGELACGDEGVGRLAEVEVIASACEDALAETSPSAGSLAGRKVLVTAGPTFEPLDPVRFLGNRSSGKMGVALAEEAAARGASVTLLAGPGVAAASGPMRTRSFATAEDLRRALSEEIDGHAVLVMAAAVADFRPAHAAPEKIRRGASGLTLQLEATPDLLAEIGARRERPFLVAFAAETGGLESSGAEKLARKGADLLVANDVSRNDIGFDSPDNEVLLLAPGGFRRALAKASKRSIAAGIWDAIEERMAERVVAK